MGCRDCVPTMPPNYYAAFLRDPDGSNIEAMTYIESSHAANTSQHCATQQKALHSVNPGPEKYT